VTLPAKYPPVVTPENWNSMVDRVNGVTADGVTIQYAYSYIVRDNGGFYEAIDQFGNLAFGGSSWATTNLVDGTDLSAVQQACVDALEADAGGTVYIFALQLSSTVTFGSTVTIIENYQGTITYFNNNLKIDSKQYPYSFIIRSSGGFYEAINAIGTLTYGGEDSTGIVDGTDLAAVQQACVTNLEASSGGVICIYELQLDSSVTYNSTVTIIEVYHGAITYYNNGLKTDSAHNTFTFHISKNTVGGTVYYYAHTASQLIYGGPNDAGGVDGELFSDVINQCLQDISDAGGGTIFLEVAEYTSTKQIVIPAVLTPKEGQERLIEIISNGAVLKIHEDLEADAIYCNSSTQYHMLRLRGFDVWCHAKDTSYYAIHLINMRGLTFENMVSGWGGTKLVSCTLVFFNNFIAVDSPNEGLYIQGGGYYFGTNLFIDNCGGNPLHAGYSSVVIDGTARAEFSNMHMYGEKGNYGGQATGLYLYNDYSFNFNNLHIQGFKSNCVKIEGSHDLTFNGLILNESGIYSDSNPMEIISNTSKPVYNVAISDFTIYSGTAAKDGLSFYAQNSANIYNIQISNGVITSADDGIVIGDDGVASTAICTNITVSNVRISAASHGIDEGGSSDYNVYIAINARDCPDGVYAAGANSKIVASWNYTSWVT
jgi:hypothetical protein